MLLEKPLRLALPGMIQRHTIRSQQEDLEASTDKSETNTSIIGTSNHS